MGRIHTIFSPERRNAISYKKLLFWLKLERWLKMRKIYLLYTYLNIYVTELINGWSLDALHLHKKGKDNQNFGWCKKIIFLDSNNDKSSTSWKYILEFVSKNKNMSIVYLKCQNVLWLCTKQQYCFQLSIRVKLGKSIETPSGEIAN